MRAFRSALLKEWRQEGRSASGFAVTALFALVAGVVAGSAVFNFRPDGQLLAGILWLILLFAGAVTLPRTFLVEDETGTANLLRLVSSPAAAFYAKATVAALQMLGVAAIAGTALLVMARAPIANPALLVVALGLGSISTAAACVLCGAVASGAANRAAVSAAIAVPLLTFLASVGTTALLPAFGDPRPIGWSACLGLGGLAAGNLVIGPPLLAAVWKR